MDFNTDKRKHATSNFERSVFKLINNSVYGKRMENLRKRINIRLVSSAKDYMNYPSKSIYKHLKFTFDKETFKGYYP